MSRYQIEPGRGGKDFVLVHGEPVGVITRQRHGNVYTCTIAGERQGGDGGECRPGSHPTWLVKRARATGLVGARLGTPKQDGLQWFHVTYAYAGHDRGDQATARHIYATRVRAASGAEAAKQATELLNRRASRWTPRFVVRSATLEAREKPRLGSIITGDEERRLDALTARHAAILARLEGAQFDQVLAADVKRRGRSDEAVRQAALANVHPDDLEAAIVAHGLGGLGGVRDDKLKADLVAARADVARLEAEYDALTRQNPLAVHFPSGEELLRAENKARRRLEQLEVRAAKRGLAGRKPTIYEALRVPHQRRARRARR